MFKWIFDNIFVITYPKNSCNSRAPLGVPRSWVGALPAPHSCPMTCRQKNGRRWTTRRAGASRGSVCSLPGVADNVKSWKSQCHCNSVCINPSTAVLCCIAVVHRGWVGWCVGGCSGRWVCGWVGGWSSVFVAMGVWIVSYFCFLDQWWFPHSLSLDDGALCLTWTYLLLLYVICGTAVLHGRWVDRFVGVNAVPRAGVLL